MCRCASTADDWLLELAHRLLGFLRGNPTPEAIQLTALTTFVVAGSQPTGLITAPPAGRPSPEIKTAQPVLSARIWVGVIFAVSEVGEDLQEDRVV